MTPEERAFLERGRVAALATVDDEGRPHAVPICFAVLEPAARSARPEPATASGTGNGAPDDGTDGIRVVSAIDEKPKSTADLQRVRNVRVNPRVTVLVDRYCEDWSRLAWLQGRGWARVLESDASSHADAVSALEEKYDQYGPHELGDRPIVSITIGRTVSWGALADG
ncbi:TIGR03668 family PPOX class F420-dependent oxidoreductase [Natrinema altunense]|uniref:PPOX class F420-dependent enzyme n=1 Tax=Natrinema altunense (strain JCM 12890 / CGMCC 1.3731 / AJ2) TaxID=1227494 RepID=L9ZC25_NATA2|nr:TIGR03668 family PPOX class F420-dependent oxidoreductase [Natrinema altunense]ELY83995.1 PPOX class F420-dependent enzyme [Natrinema altunense JCM 12890]